ncbi:unnamed protein product [Amaranthus hypochondriacus]
MVLGKKKKKGTSFQVDYIVSVLEIKPWPPSVALCSVQTVLIQWENGDQNSGFLPPGVPSLNGFDDGKIEFNEFFKLTVTLTGKSSLSFQKNNLEFHLYEPKKDKAVKGQLLGTAVINLAEFGIIRDARTLNTPIIISKKVSKGTVQPVLYVQIQPFDNEGIESVLRMMSEQCDDDSEFTSMTDDDDQGSSISSRSMSFHAGNSSIQIDEMLNFVNVGLNSDLVGATKVQEYEKDEGRMRKSIESKEYAHSEDDLITGRNSLESNNVFGKFSEVATTKKHTSRSISTLKFGKKGLDLHGFGDKLKHIKSVKVSSDSPRASPPMPLQFFDKSKEESAVKEVQVDIKSQEKKEKKEKKSVKPDNTAELESKIKMLEEELREAAALEIGLYSVVAEHLNSKRKVHAPARRLSRFYRHVCKMESHINRASSARTIVSGLVMVSKACGNDVSRLTFWLSNMIILRAMVSQITEEIPPSDEPTNTERKPGRKKSEKKSLVNDTIDSLGDWEDPKTFIMALEKVEAWLFFRIIEGLWWQSFAPHMQPTKKKKKGKRLTARRTQRWKFGLGDQEQGNFSTELWKKAFHDACERLCPIRAGGHDCGCLPMLSKMVLEQLVDRLDVAMFNAILRDSEDEMPTDPLSDPISEPKVLPIPAGKSSFGAGAQLKNAVGSWSKWLSDFFGLEEDEPSKDKDESNQETSYKAFHLLNALGDLMMLPLGMLSDASTRKEVCPIFGGSLIKRVFTNFIPDEFSPDPITDELLESLDSENSQKSTNDCITSLPCGAKPVVYSPLPTVLFSGLLGDSSSQAQKKNGSSLLRKSHNSDDELDKLSVPLASINVQNICIEPASSKPNWMPKGKGGRDVVRYQLLQEAWRNGT